MCRCLAGDKLLGRRCTVARIHPHDCEPVVLPRDKTRLRQLIGCLRQSRIADVGTVEIGKYQHGRRAEIKWQSRALGKVHPHAIQFGLRQCSMCRPAKQHEYGQ